MSLTRLSPALHVVRDTPAARLFRRHLRDPDILTFFSMETGQWVLAYYIHRPSRLVDEIEDLGTNFESLSRKLVERISSCWGRVDLSRKKRRLLGQDRDRKRKKTDDLCETQELWDWTRKRKRVNLPYAYG